MPLSLIKGQYRVLHTSPDGDSIKFYADDPGIWRRLRLRVHANHTGGVQLRLDGIDALETHYLPKGGTLGMQHQPVHFAKAAASALLEFIGFHHVTRGDNGIVSAARPDYVEGYILTRYADVYGRAVAFAFKGHAQQADGADVQLDTPLLLRSANYHILTHGLAYPTYYTQLYPDIRREMTKAVHQARATNTGLWPGDKTLIGFELDSVQAITDNHVILPKLFRRLMDYLAINDGAVSLTGFKSYLESRNDRIVILPEGHVTGFDFVVDVKGQTTKLTTAPEDLVFIEK